MPLQQPKQLLCYLERNRARKNQRSLTTMTDKCEPNREQPNSVPEAMHISRERARPRYPRARSEYCMQAKSTPRSGHLEPLGVLGIGTRTAESSSCCRTGSATSGGVLGLSKRVCSSLSCVATSMSSAPQPTRVSVDDPCTCGWFHSWFRPKERSEMYTVSVVAWTVCPCSRPSSCCTTLRGTELGRIKDC